MQTHITTFAAFTLLSMFIVDGATGAEGQQPTIELLARGTNYAISAFHGSVTNADDDDVPLQQGIVVIHVDLATGSLTSLISSGVYANSNVNQSFRSVRVIGLDTNGEFLGMLIFRGEAAKPDDKFAGGWAVRSGLYQLELFSKTTGKRVASRLIDSALPEQIPSEKLKTEEFKMTEDGCVVFGVSFAVTRVGGKIQVSTKK